MRRVILSGRSRMCCLARQYSVSWSLLRWCQVRMLMYYWLFRQYYSLECRRSSFSFDRSSLRLRHRVDDVNRPEYWQGLCHMVHPRCVGSHICSSRTSALQTYHHIMLIVFSRCSSLKVVQRLRNPNLFFPHQQCLLLLILSAVPFSEANTWIILHARLLGRDRECACMPNEQKNSILMASEIRCTRCAVESRSAI